MYKYVNVSLRNWIQCTFGVMAGQAKFRSIDLNLSSSPRDIQFSWDYKEAHHFKGPLDGIGVVPSSEKFTRMFHPLKLSVMQNTENLKNPCCLSE